MRRFGNLPGLGAFFLTHGHGVELPALGAGRGIEGHHRPANAPVTPGEPDEHLAVPCDGRAAEELPDAAVGDLLFPHQFPGGGTECHQPAAGAAAVDPAVEVSHAAVDREGVIGAGGVDVAPYQAAGAGVQCDGGVRRGDKHRVADDDRTGLEAALLAHAELADGPELRHVLGGDLIQRREALAVETAVVSGPGVVGERALKVPSG